MLGVGGKFRYLHQLKDRDDAVAFLEFARGVDGKKEGVDKLTFDQDSLITELKVMIPPGFGSRGRRGKDGRGVPTRRPTSSGLTTAGGPMFSAPKGGVDGSSPVRVSATAVWRAGENRGLDATSCSRPSNVPLQTSRE